MPRDNDKNNDSRGRRDRPGGGKGRADGGKGRSGAARGPEKKFAKRGFAGKDDGECPWTVEDGNMTVKKGSGDIHTKEKFGKSVADRQAVAAALSTARKSGSKKSKSRRKGK